MWLLAGSCAFITGVALNATQNPLWLALLCPPLAFTFLLSRRTRLTVVLLVTVTIVCALLGALRQEQALPVEGAHLISHFNESGAVVLHATVAEEPDYGGSYTQVLLNHIRVEKDELLLPVKGKVLITTSDPRPLHYGDTVLLRVALETPPKLGEFDYAGHLALRGIYSTAFCATLKVTQSEDNDIRARLLALNSRMGKAIGSVLPEPEASLAQSILLGRRGGLSDSLSHAFVRTGTAHLLAISGLHLGILVATAVTILLAVIGRRHYLYVWLALLALWTYAVFTGLRPPVVRAALMATTFLVAELAGRQRHGPTALALAAAIMVGIDPQLMWQTSFQLSVLAMSGLILLYRPIQAGLAELAALGERRMRLPVGGSDVVRDITSATLAATIAIWPVAALTFGEVSLIGIPVSVLTIPLLPIALGSAAIAGGIALFSTVLAMPFAWVAWLFLTSIVKLVELFSQVPFAMVEYRADVGWLLAGYYAMLCATSVIWQRLARSTHGTYQSPTSEGIEDASPHRLRWALPPLLLMAVLIWSAVLASPDGKMHVIFLDVGQGDSALIVSPTGRTVLIDGGLDGRTTGALIDNHVPFWNRKIDIVIATHPHADHISGLINVVDRFTVGVALESCGDSSTVIQDEWNRRVQEASVDPVCVIKGQELLLKDGVHIQVLNPTVEPLSGTIDDIDNNGIVARISYGEMSFLFTADIMHETELLLVHTSSPLLDCDVLKVAHHGSSSSSTAQFLAAVAPAVAVISAGEDNRYGHPHQEVVERLIATGAEVLTTAEHGTLEFVTDGRELWVRTERPGTHTLHE